jgi:hypothetical protein
MRIKCAAIKYDGKIFEGRSHPEIGQKMIKDGVCPKPFPGGEAQGFVTDEAIFVDREKALIIAIEAGQVVEGETSHGRELFSEDLR